MIGRIIERLSAQLPSRGAILTFHSVAREAEAPLSVMHLTAQQGQAVIEQARRVGSIVPLAELVARHLDGRYTAGMVAITFDDAYHALLGEGAALLDGTPVTICVVSEAAEHASIFWWDRLDAVRASVSLERWNGFEARCGVTEAMRAQLAGSSPLRELLLGRYQGILPESIEAELRGMEDEIGRRTAQRSMSEAELRRIAARPGVTLAVHTRRHAVLPLLAPEEQVAEIAGCHAWLRERFPDVLPILAIPFGLFDAATVTAAARAGMTAALTLTGRTLGGPPSPAIPRICLDRRMVGWRLQMRLAGMRQRIPLGTPSAGPPPLPVIR